eukprot:7218037-Alexandrium_andersonii.AAC.1
MVSRGTRIERGTCGRWPLPRSPGAGWSPAFGVARMRSRQRAGDLEHPRRTFARAFFARP